MASSKYPKLLPKDVFSCIELLLQLRIRKTNRNLNNEDHEYNFKYSPMVLNCLQALNTNKANESIIQSVTAFLCIFIRYQTIFAVIVCLIVYILYTGYEQKIVYINWRLQIKVLHFI